MSVIQTKGGEALEMSLKILPHMIQCILCYSFEYFDCSDPENRETVVSVLMVR